MNHSKQGSAVVNTNLVALELRSKPLMSSFEFASYFLVEKMTPVFYGVLKIQSKKVLLLSFKSLAKQEKNKKKR